MKPDKLVSNWLLVLCVMVFGMVAGGGHARTIGAGFIMQVWAPITGFVPPLTQTDWNHVFGLFQQTAQYQAHPIDLTQFKALFWPMFFDRCWGRLMAVVFIVPLIIFWRTRRISNKMALWLLALFASGGAQAIFGWLMVRTGLLPGMLSPPAVMAAPHFLSAMFIFAALLWTALTVRDPAAKPVIRATALRSSLNGSIALILLTMGFGALVATTNAITVYHSFPLMDGQLVPNGVFALHPWAENFLANLATVQFFHRSLASLTALSVIVTCIMGLRNQNLSQGARDVFLVLAGLVTAQYLLGMVTIVLGSVDLGYVHELNAVLLLAASITARHGLRGAIPNRARPNFVHAIGGAE